MTGGPEATGRPEAAQAAATKAAAVHRAAVAALETDGKLADWLSRHAAGPGSDLRVPLPGPLELPARLLDLAVPHEDVNGVLAAHAAVLADPFAARLLECAARLVVRDIGTVGAPFELPSLPPASGVLGRYFAVLVFVAALPHTREYHDRHGVPADVSRRTLADLGRNMAVHRRRYGTGGLLHPEWVVRHFRGLLYQLGRLQFERVRLGGRTGRGIAAAGQPVAPGSPALGIHIPDYSGPLTPAACDDALGRAGTFFPRRFPDERPTLMVCQSWLLDGQLRAYLPPESNVIRFQDRFRTAYRATEAADSDPVAFVFGDPHLPPDTLPRRTTLERAVVDHLLAGRHWYIGNGWFPLEDEPGRGGA